MNVIDALVVTLGMDATKFTVGSAQARKNLKNTSDEAGAAAKEMEAKGKQAAQFFASIKVEALSLLAIFTAGAGLKSFIKESVSSSAEIGRLAKNIGLGTEQLSAWENMAARSGGTADGMAGTFRNVSTELAKIKLGLSTDFVQWFARAGGDFTKLKDANGTMIELSRIISDLDKKDPGKALLIAKNLGVDEGTFNVLRQGPAYVMAQLEAQKKLGVVTEEDSKRAQALQARFEELKQSSEALGRGILTAAAPAIEFMAKKLSDLGIFAQQHGPAVKAFFTVVSAAVVGAALAIGGVPMAIMLLLTAAIAGVAAAIGYVYEQWTIWMDGGKSSLSGFFQFFSDTWAKIYTIFGGIFDALGNAAKAWWTAIKSVLALVRALFFGTGDEVRDAWKDCFAAIGDYWDSLLTVFSNAGPAILRGIKAGLSAAFSWAKGRVSAIWNAITGTPDPAESPTAEATAPVASRASAPRGVRNNNPGNLNFAGQAGATKETGPGGRFAVFGSMEQGVSALVNQLKFDASRGIDTISAIVKKYAPPGENNVGAYIKELTQAVGVGADEKLNLGDDKTLLTLVKGITSHTSAPRGVRNNNPGNLNFAGQAGATKETGPGGRFAVFGSMEQGVSALVNQLKLYASRGIDTISAIVKKYAPAGENDVGAYIKALTQAMGVGADEKLNLGDDKTLLKLVKGIASHENGAGYVSDQQIVAGARMASGSNVRSTSTSSSEVKIAQMTINTQSTDAAGIARDAQAAFRVYPMTGPQANTGLN